MKIKSQFTLLILFMVFSPLLFLLTIVTNQYLNSPQRHLMKGYKEIRALGKLDFSETDWSILQEEIKTIPANVQTLIYHNHTVILSTMPEIQPGTTMHPSDFFDLIDSSSDIYDYQMQAPVGPKSKNISKAMQPPPKFLVLSRTKTAYSKKEHLKHLYTIIFSSIVLFEFICIAILINISKTITSSITLLEKSTMKIANGELETAIDNPKKNHYSNEITSLSQSLEKMRITIKDAQERRVKFLMGISHDLRTPIALIKGYTEAITDGIIEDKESVSKSLSIIHSKADQLETMINDLINYVKLNNTDWRQSLENISLYPILKEFADYSMNTATIYKRNITAHIDIDKQFTVCMDKNLFTRALENLFSNALRYTSDNDSIHIQAKEDSESVLLEISDTGIGISKDDFEHIYEIFYRGTNSRRESGMGIGLSVVKTIIDIHGWKIDVKSELNKGTKFTITIPK